MMKVNVWDEISQEWGIWDLEIPQTRDPEAINSALSRAVAGEDGDDWEVESSSVAGPVLTIVSRDSSGHLSIIVVNSEDQ